MPDKQRSFLYRCEFEPEITPDGVDAPNVEFVAAESEMEAAELMEGWGDERGVYGIRKATEAEVIAYAAGYDDGSFYAVAKERLDNDTGVVWQLTRDDGTISSRDMKKMFYCGGCNELNDFEDAVKVGRNYLVRLHKDTELPWHVCIKCV